MVQRSVKSVEVGGGAGSWKVVERMGGVVFWKDIEGMGWRVLEGQRGNGVKGPGRVEREWDGGSWKGTEGIE